MADIRISRNGEVVGLYDENTLAKAIKVGIVQRDDWAWYDGLTEWVPVESLIETSQAAETAPIKQRKAATKKTAKAKEPKRVKPKIKRVGGKRQYTLTLAPKHRIERDVRDWTQDLITLKQIKYISEFGVSVPETLTKGQASVMLDELIATKPKIAERHERKKLRRRVNLLKELKAQLAEAKRQLHAAHGNANIRYHREQVGYLKASIKELKREQGKKGCGCLWLILLAAAIIFYMWWMSPH